MGIAALREQPGIALVAPFLISPSSLQTALPKIGVVSFSLSIQNGLNVAMVRDIEILPAGEPRNVSTWQHLT
jgi:hypothetical protein